MQDLHFRSGYAETTDGLSELIKLIQDVFEIDVSPLNRLGHDPSVVSFGWWRGDRLVANVSLYQRRLWLLGKEVPAFGVQSVAVRPEWRGRGLFRDLMTRALAFADARTSLVILETGTPALYQPFGFRQIEEARFSGGLKCRQSRPNYRALSLDEESDVALLRDLFSRRAPTSLLASACDHPALFMLKAALTPEIKLLHLEDLEAVVAVMGLDQPSLTLLDIVAASIPPLEAIVSALGYGGERVEVHLTPDRLAWTPDQQHPIESDCMVRGVFPVEGQAFMLSEMRT